MDTEKEINSLAAETLALQTVLTHILDRISQADARLASAIREGFSDAASDVEDLAIKFGKAASPHHTVKALGTVETLRAATLGDHDQPSHSI